MRASRNFTVCVQRWKTPRSSTSIATTKTLNRIQKSINLAPSASLTPNGRQAAIHLAPIRWSHPEGLQSRRISRASLPAPPKRTSAPRTMLRPAQPDAVPCTGLSRVQHPHGFQNHGADNRDALGAELVQRVLRGMVEDVAIAVIEIN